MKVIVMEFILEALVSCTNNTAGNVIASIRVSLLHYNVAIAGRRPQPAAGAAGRTTICTPFGLPVLKCTPWTQPGGHPCYLQVILKPVYYLFQTFKFCFLVLYNIQT